MKRTSCVVGFILFIMLSFTKCFANQDSLWAVWQNEKALPTERLAALQALNDSYEYKQPDTWQRVIELQLQYATDLKNDFWIAKSFDNKAEWYSSEGQLDSAIVYSNRAIAIFEQIEKREEIGEIYLRMGYDAYQKANIKGALEWMERTRKFGIEYERYDLVANSLNALGGINFAHGNITEALDFFLQQLHIFETKEFEKAAVNSPYADIAMVYSELNELDSALLYIEKDLSYEDSYHPGKPTFKLVPLSYKGEILEKQGRMQAARKIYEQMMNLGTEVVYEDDLLYPLSVYTEFLFEQQDDQANFYTDSLIRLAEKYTYRSYLAKGYTLKGGLLLKENNNAEALSFCQSALDLLGKDGEYDELSPIYDCLYKTHKALRNYEQALVFYEKHQQLKEEMLNEKNIRKLTQLEMQAIAEKDKATAQLTYENNLQRQRFVQYGLISGLSFMAILAFFIYRNYRNKVKANQLITAQKAELETLNATKDRLFAIIGHDLRKPSLAFRGIGKKIDYLLQKQDFDTLSKLSQALEQAAFSLNALLDNLLNWALQQRNVLPYQPVPINIAQATQDIYEQFRALAAQKDIDLQFDLSTDAEVFADANAFATIMRNLVDNAIKFTPAQGRVKVSSLVQGDKVVLQISDTGIGMEAEELNTLFQLTRQKSRKGTNGEVGTGLGLVLTNELVKLNKGVIQVSSQLQQGTTFKIMLPTS